MIYTVTLNPAVDKTYVVDEFKTCSLNRAERIIYNAGSKGINVSRVLKQLGIDTTVLGFVGGRNGEVLLNELATEGIQENLIKVESNTRLNIKIMDKSTKNVTEINEMGNPVEESEMNKFMDLYKKSVLNSTGIVISGSILPEMYKKIYYELISIAKKAGKTVFLDCGGNLLYDGILASPDYIKPNKEEFESMLGKHNLTNEQIVIEAKKIIEKHNVKYVVVTLSGDGAVAVSKTEQYHITPTPIDVVSTVGAGDAFLAGLCHGYLQNLDFRAQLTLATSYASAKITKEGNNIPSLIELAGYTNGISINPLSF